MRRLIEVHIEIFSRSPRHQSEVLLYPTRQSESKGKMFLKMVISKINISKSISGYSAKLNPVNLALLPLNWTTLYVHSCFNQQINTQKTRKESTFIWNCVHILQKSFFKMRPATDFWSLPKQLDNLSSYSASSAARHQTILKPVGLRFPKQSLHKTSSCLPCWETRDNMDMYILDF